MIALLPTLVAVVAYILTRSYVFTLRSRIVHALLGALIGFLVWYTMDGIWLALVLVQHSIASDLYVASCEG